MYLETYEVGEWRRWSNGNCWTGCWASIPCQRSDTHACKVNGFTGYLW